MQLSKTSSVPFWPFLVVLHFYFCPFLFLIIKLVISWQHILKIFYFHLLSVFSSQPFAPLPILLLSSISFHLLSILLFGNFPPQPLPASYFMSTSLSLPLYFSPTGTVDQRVLGDKYPGPRAHQPPIPATLLCHIVAEASLKRH